MIDYSLIDFKNFKQSRAVRTGAFLLAFVMIFCSLSSFVFTTKNGAHYKSKYYPQYAFQDERKNSLQILGIGNSNLYSAFDVPDLWHDYGYTASMAAVGFQSPSVSYQLLKKAYETQKPKIVLIETDILYDEKPIQSHGVTPKTTVFDYFKTEFIDDKLQSVFPILKFHDMWKQPIDNKYNIDTPDSHGFKYDSRNGKYNVPNYMAKTDRTEDVSEINIYYLIKFQFFQLSHLNNQRLIYLHQQHTRAYMSCYLLKLFQQIHQLNLHQPYFQLVHNTLAMFLNYICQQIHQFLLFHLHFQVQPYNLKLYLD